MEFWGLEVQPGQTVKVNPGENKYLHLSQVSLGERKKEKGAEGASVFVKFDDKKLVLGTLYADKCAQIQHDLVFEKEFELSHGSKNTSVCFMGYKIAVFVESDDISDPFNSESESDEGNPLDVPINGKLEVKTNDKAAMPNAQKAEASDGRSKAKIEQSKKDDKLKAKAEDDDDSEEDESDDDEDDEEMVDGEDGSDDEDESSEEEEEATPKKVEVGNKRPANSSSKTPDPEKKAKLVSSGGNQKPGADGKKGGHIATPYPAKQGKTPANSVDKSKQQAPKPAGCVACKSCSKTFNSENALQSHTKAKHS
ncbi:histone deacetylase HDT2-like [Zingiber officinale]|uniref:histone deacetylase HDT2-like n=1 Tax=Zingiber officinale TaxID=94328 RepID=UPI001C4C5045|nr:histone deacetylase HDT2-like [Zingiber officinale]